MLHDTLASDHYVQACGRAADALVALERTTFDVVLCDVNMPEMDGPTFLARVQARSSEDARRIVFMTGDRTHPLTAAFVDSISNLCLDKPFDLDDVRALIARRVRGPARIAREV